MKRTIMVLLMCLTLHAAFAQKISLSFNDVSMSKALETISSVSSEYSIMFLYDELEDFTVTTRIVKQNIPDAIRQIIGFYPMKMTIDGKNIYVECIQKTKQKLIGKVVDQKGQPLEFANITLLNPSDSSFITGGASNAAGDFVVPCENKVVLAKFTYVGYKTILKRMNVENVGKISMSTDPQYIGEVTIVGSKVINLADRQLLIPTKETIKHSNSGYDLIQKVDLPGIYVDMINKKVEKRGAGSVPLFINEKRASQVDVVALRPDEVLRIEYINNPGAEFGLETPTAIINFIVKPRIKGMSIGFDLTDAMTTMNGQNYVYAQYNHRLSKWGVYYQNDFSELSRRHIDQSDIYTLADGKLHEIRREGINTKLAYANHDFGITYDLTRQGHYTFMAQASSHFYNSPDRGHRQRIYETGNPMYYALTEPTEHYFSPTLDLFFRRYFKKNHTLTLNIVGTMFDTKYGYSYKTFTDEDFVTSILQYGYHTDGKRYSVIGDVKYSQPLGKLNWTSGINYLQGYTQNKYTGTADTINVMHNSSTYLYSQISGSLGNLRYLFGLGGSYQYYTQENESYHYFLLRPSLNLNYPIFGKGNVRYVFNIVPVAPSLANLSHNRQQSNEYEFHVGNPSLKPYNRVTQTLSISYQHQYFYVENTTGYMYSKNPILEEITRESYAGGKTWFDFGYARQKHSADFWNYTNAQLYIIPDIFTLNGGFSYLASRNVGNNYTHDFHRIWGFVGAKLFFGKWNASASWSAKERSFSGESENIRGQNMEIQVNCKINPSLTIGLYGSHLFQKNGSTFGETTNSQYVRKNSTVYIPEWGNMISLNLSWNLSRGRRYNSDSKGVWNRDNETGIFKNK